MNVAAKLIPQFAMYGEPPSPDAGDFLRLETIESRCHLFDWTIRAHTHADLNHVFWVSRGGGEMFVDHNRIPYEAPALLLIPAREVHAFQWQKDSTGWMLTISDICLDGLCVRAPNFRMLFEKAERLSIEPEKYELQAVQFEIGRLLNELNGTAPYHHGAVESRLTTILIDLLRHVENHSRQHQVPPTPHTRTVARFRALVEENFHAGLTLQSYADKLGISPSRLRAACMRVTGSSPAQLIQERRLVEARRLLLYTPVTIAEVAYHLGFCDPAYFSRVFRSRFGQSPRALRKQSFAESTLA